MRNFELDSNLAERISSSVRSDERIIPSEADNSWIERRKKIKYGKWYVTFQLPNGGIESTVIDYDDFIDHYNGWWIGTIDRHINDDSFKFILGVKIVNSDGYGWDSEAVAKYLHIISWSKIEDYSDFYEQ